MLKCVSVCKTEALHTEDDCSSALLCCTEGPGDTYFAGNEYNGTIRHLVRGEKKEHNTNNKQRLLFFQRLFCHVHFCYDVFEGTE